MSRHHPSVYFVIVALLSLWDSPAQETGKERTAVEKIKQARNLLREAKADLAKEERYNCCIEEPCNQCALDHQSCPCYKDLKAGKPVCPECYGGWQRGEGTDKSIDPHKVKTRFSKHRH